MLNYVTYRLCFEHRVYFPQGAKCPRCSKEAIEVPICPNFDKDEQKLTHEADHYEHELFMALYNLCLLKIHKDANGKTDIYLENQPRAWKKAMELVGLER